MSYSPTSAFPSPFFDLSEIASSFKHCRKGWISEMTLQMAGVRWLAAAKLGPRFNAAIDSQLRQLFDAFVAIRDLIDPGDEWLAFDFEERLPDDGRALIGECEAFCRVSSYVADLAQSRFMTPTSPCDSHRDQVFDELVCGLASDTCRYWPSRPSGAHAVGVPGRAVIKRAAESFVAATASASQSISDIEAAVAPQGDEVLRPILLSLAHQVAAAITRRSVRNWRCDDETWDTIWSAYDYVPYARHRLIVFAMQSVRLQRSGEVRREAEALWQALIPLYREFLNEEPWWSDSTPGSVGRPEMSEQARSDKCARECRPTE